MTTPGPGIYYDVPASDYFAWEAVSNSRLSLLAKSPRHYKLGGNVVETKAMSLGTLVHNGALEPLSIAERYAVMPAYELDDDNQTDAGKPSTSKATRYYKDKAAAFREANQGKQFVEGETYGRMRSMVESLAANKEARDLINGPGPVEVSMIWDDPATGIRCKGRIDKANTEVQALVDLKSSGNIFKFSRSMADYGYARQLAHYRMGWAVLNGGDLLHPWLVAIESAEPHCVMPAPLGESSLESGDVERTRLMSQLADCLESGEWPGPESPESWELPAWAIEEGSRFVETETEIIAT